MKKQPFSLALAILMLFSAGLFSLSVQAQIVSARVSGTTGQTVTGPLQLVRFSTVDFDTHSAISGIGTASFKFTAPVDGFYELGATCLTSAPASSGGVNLYVYKNGAVITMLDEVNQSGNTYFPMIVSGSTVVELSADDEITIHIGGDTVSLDTANENSHFYIFRVN